MLCAKYAMRSVLFKADSSIFLMCNFRSPLNLLNQVSEMRSVLRETPIVATALASIERHLNWLSPELVIFALFDLDVPGEERQEMASKLFSYSQQWEPGERLIYATSVPGPDFCLGDTFWQGNSFFPSTLMKHHLLSQPRILSHRWF